MFVRSNPNVKESKYLEHINKNTNNTLKKKQMK